jgi:hypothetical protein
MKAKKFWLIKIKGKHMPAPIEILTTLMCDEFASVYPNGGDITLTDSQDSQFISYGSATPNIVDNTTTPASLNLTNNTQIIFDLNGEGSGTGSDFTWIAFSQGHTDPSKDELIGKISSSPSRWEFNSHNPNASGIAIENLTMQASFNYNGKAYNVTWDPKVIIGGGSGN